MRITGDIVDIHDGAVGQQAPGALAHREDGIHHRNIHKLAFAGSASTVDGREDSESEHYSRYNISNAGTDFDRLAGFGAGNSHDPAHRLRDDVVSWPFPIRRRS